jgi:hypothetical protein
MSARPEVVTVREELALFVFGAANPELADDELAELFFKADTHVREFWLRIADAVRAKITEVEISTQSRMSMVHSTLLDLLVKSGKRVEDLEMQLHKLMLLNAKACSDALATLNTGKVT